MWNTDKVYLQTSTEVNTYGSIAQTWTSVEEVLCDVQDISSEYAYKKYGLTESNEMRQVFAPTNTAFEKLPLSDLVTLYLTPSLSKWPVIIPTASAKAVVSS